MNSHHNRYIYIYIYISSSLNFDDDLGSKMLKSNYILPFLSNFDTQNLFLKF